MYTKLFFGLFTLFLANTTNIFANTFIVGTGAGCTHSSLAGAVAAAANNAGFDTIRVTRSIIHSNIAITINNQDLLLEGRWPACNSTSRDTTNTTVNGNNATSVISIMGGTGVSITGLQITAGNNVSGRGGGIHIQQTSAGSVFLGDVLINNNGAQLGAGVSIYSNTTNPDSGSRLTLGENVSIRFNTASASGGGLHCQGSRVSAIGSEIEFASNLSNDSGGAINAEYCDLALSSEGGAFNGMFIGNQAINGGGAIRLVNSTAKAFSFRSDKPVRFAGNTATDGGAISVLDLSSFEAIDAQFENNRAYSNGGAIYQYNGVALGTNRVLIRRHSDGDLGSRCNAPECGQIRNNISRTIDNASFRAGAVLRTYSIGNQGLVESIFAGQNIYENQGYSVFRSNEFTNFDGEAKIVLENCLVHNNFTNGGGIIYTASNANHFILNTTTSNNQLENNPVFSISANAMRPNRLTIRNSIFFETANNAISASPMPIADINHLRTLNNNLYTGNNTITLGDPGFQNAQARDFGLSSTSTARDVAPTYLGVYSNNLDFIGNPRSVDLPFVLNGVGTQDLGAIETPGDAVFKNGFE